jgi:nucleotide-binding universal stress UspA family protein
VLAEATAVSAYLGATLVVCHAVPRSFAERSVGLQDALDRGRWQLSTAAGAVAGQLPAGSCVVSQLARVRPHELVGEALDADLLVMGGPRADADRTGLVLSSALHHAPCPVLLAPRTTDTVLTG